MRNFMFKNRNVIKKMFAMLIVAMLLIANVVSASASSTILVPGTSDYLSLHSYVSATDIANVYKVTQTISTPPIQSTKPEVYVAITLDRSGSMGSSDIWDSDNGTTITRYKALDIAVAATIQALLDDGNPNIYLNISPHDNINTSGSGNNGTGMPTTLDTLADPNTKFVSLYDPATGLVRDEFDSSNTSTWIMNNWNTTANGWSGGSNRFDYPFSRIHGIFANGIAGGYIPTDSVRYILAMGDGDDTGATASPSTMDWATALKATPLDSGYAAGSSTAANTVAGVGGGIGATIWGVTVGSATQHVSTYETDIMNGITGTLGTSAWTTLYEPRMIGSTMEIPAGLNVYGSAWGSSALAIDDYVAQYSTNGLSSLTEGTHIHYTHSCYLKNPGSTTALSAGSSLVDAFTSFGAAAGNAAVAPRSALTTVSTFNSMYSIYQYKSEPLVAFDYTTTSTTSTTIPNQTYSISGNSVIWNIDTIEDSATLTMVYYVRFDASSADADLYYPLFSSSSLSLTYLGDPYNLTFPQLYVKGSGDSTKADDAVTVDVTGSSGTSSSSTDTNSWDGGYGLTASYAIPSGTQPYTASVTPAPTAQEEVLEVEHEVLEEDTLSVPATGTGLYVLIAVLATCLAFGAYASIKKRNK